LLATNLMTLGLLTITTAGGAMGGYLFRWRQSRQALDRLSTLPMESGKNDVVPDAAGDIDTALKSTSSSLPVPASQSTVIDSRRGKSAPADGGRPGAR
ncbi:MAG: hypothetical protein HKN42_16575, partial [Granulosicoccus sp.]|nr:hypothetical protein [Granulosicoccus sp.]